MKSCPSLPRCRAPLSGRLLHGFSRFLLDIVALFAPARPADTGAMAAEHRAAANAEAEQLLTQYGNSVLRLAYSYPHNTADPEETLLQFLKAAPALDSAALFAADVYLYRLRFGNGRREPVLLIPLEQAT